MTRSVAEIDVGALAHNVRQLRACAGPGPRLCAVVKADGYGHGAVRVARAALGAGADWLAVAHAEEGAALRRAGIDAPILLLSEPVDAEEVASVAAHRLRATVYSPAAVDALAATGAPLALHLKVDTGMHRVGAAPDELVALAVRIERAPNLRLEGLCTHCASADEPSNPLTGVQLDRFLAADATLRAAGFAVELRHGANSAAVIAWPAARLDLVRPGIALYGVAPAAALAGRIALRPVLTWRSQVSLVKRVAAGEGISYGHHRHLERDSFVATVPVGYADGLVRRWGLTGGAVLIGGRRRSILGVVTMDQVMVDCGDDATVTRGDDVVLIGRQGDRSIGAEELAAATGTIAYEILTGIARRVRRVTVDSSGVADPALGAASEDRRLH